MGDPKVVPETNTVSIPIKELYKDLYGANTVVYSAIWRGPLIVNFAIWWDSLYKQQYAVNIITFVYIHIVGITTTIYSSCQLLGNFH